MPRGSVKVKFETKRLQAMIRAYGERAQNPPMRLVGEIIAAEVDDVIQSEGEAGTKGKWEGFSQKTLELHPRRVGGMLLQDTGLLANLQTRSNAVEAEVASPAPYATFHVTGTKNMPARNFLAIDFDRVMEQIVVAWVNDIES